MIRKEKLELKYAFLWIITSLILITLSFFPELVVLISSSLGIELPSNAVFLIGNFFMLMILFSLTIALSRHSSRNKNLTQELAILKTRMDKLEGYPDKQGNIVNTGGNF